MKPIGIPELVFTGAKLGNLCLLAPKRAFVTNVKDIALARVLSFNFMTYAGYGNVRIATIGHDSFEIGEHQ